jgi:hypothetical protein
MAKNVTLAKPTTAIATNSIPSSGANAAKVMQTPKTSAARDSAREPVFPRAAVQSPPITAPAPMAASNSPYVAELP